ncbi:MAG: hypothetical protein E6I89_16975 [Chloroflexi bacterium]|nr:MAG: hypothetical protein E6I89_16975 [Chloroflexota bacterium]
MFRAWFFQQLATTNGVRDWTGFDRTLAAARRHGFRVIATLIDQWGDCGASTTPGYGYKTDTWYRSGYMQPDPIGTTSYLGWAGEVATRYRDDPTILAWQLVNEAEVKTAQNGPCAADAAQVLKTFAGNASGVIRGTDPNHLISLGTIGTGQCGAQGAEYSDVHSLENIDLCEYHDYSPNEAMPGDIYNGLQVRINQCNALDKPLFVGESGIRPMDVGGTLGARARAFQAKFERQFEAGVVGELVWAWDKNGSLTDNYDIGPGDPALGVISGTTSLMGIESFAISNDGRRLALSAERNGVEGLYLADRDGTNAVFLAADSHPLRPYFTPNDDAKSHPHCPETAPKWSPSDQMLRAARSARFVLSTYPAPRRWTRRFSTAIQTWPPRTPRSPRTAPRSSLEPSVFLGRLIRRSRASPRLAEFPLS